MVGGLAHAYLPEESVPKSTLQQVINHVWLSNDLLKSRVTKFVINFFQTTIEIKWVV
jgi:hypothetical protein